MRRVSRLALVMVTAGALLVAAPVSDSFATNYDCSPIGYHCYAQASFGPLLPGYIMKGDGMSIEVDCLQVPDPNQAFVTAETWVATNGSTDNWVEAGLSFGAPNGGTIVTFWADQRPGGGYHEHPGGAGSGSRLAYYGERIQQATSSTWNVQIGVLNGVSTANPGPSIYIGAGSETNESNTAYTKVSMFTKNMGFFDGNGNFKLAWGYSHGHAYPNDIPSDYGFAHIDPSYTAIHAGTSCV